MIEMNKWLNIVSMSGSTKVSDELVMLKQPEEKEDKWGRYHLRKNTLSVFLCMRD